MESWKQAKRNENRWPGIHAGQAVQGIQNELSSGVQRYWAHLSLMKTSHIAHVLFYREPLFLTLGKFRSKSSMFNGYSAAVLGNKCLSSVAMKRSL